MFEQGTTQVVTIQDFIKYAPLGLILSGHEDSTRHLHYDASKSYPWRYCTQDLQGCWRWLDRRTATQEHQDAIRNNYHIFDAYDDHIPLYVIQSPRPLLRRRNNI